MPTLIDKAGNRHDYTTMVQWGDSIELDGSRFLPGRLADFTIEGVPSDPLTNGVKVTPPQFKLLFKAAERIAIAAARNPGQEATEQQLAVKAMLDDAYDVLDDPRLTEVNLSLQSTRESVTGVMGYLSAIGVVEDPEARIEAVLSGVVL